MEKSLKMVPTLAVDDAEYQTRLGIDDEKMRELTESVRRDGVLCPILVTPDLDGYTIIAGHRRFKAAVAVGLQEIPCQIVPADEKGRWSGAFAENMFRADLSVIEEACSIKDVLTSGQMDLDSLCRALGKTGPWIEDRLAIAEWPEDIQEVVHTGGLSCAAARHLAMIDDEMHRKMLLSYAVENGATARATAAWYQAWKANKEYVDPEGIEVAGPANQLPPIEPHCPCVICGLTLKMVELHYSPVCGGCSELVVEMARHVRSEQVDGGGLSTGGQR